MTEVPAAVVILAVTVSKVTEPGNSTPGGYELPYEYLKVSDVTVNAAVPRGISPSAFTALLEDEVDPEGFVLDGLLEGLASLGEPMAYSFWGTGKEREIVV